MTFRDNVRSILDCHLFAIKEELKDQITDKIINLKCHDIIYHGVSDINDVKDWVILGYRVEDLYKLALILRDRRIEDVNLKDYNNCFLDGYKRAKEDIHKQIDETINKMINKEV